jgi:hypothetical protein
VNIKDILDNLGLDLSNPETKRGALEAIEAILNSRTPPESFGGGGGGSMSGGSAEDIEVDPDLLQPSVKHQTPDTDADVEIEDEENLMNQVKFNDSEETPEGDTSGNEASNSNDSSSSGGSEDSEESSNDSDSEGSGAAGSGTEDSSTESEKSETKPETTDPEQTQTEDELEDSEGTKAGEKEGESSDEGEGETETTSTQNGGEGEANDTSETNPTEGSEEELEDDEDLLDDTLKNAYADKAITAKHEARRIKRERTLQAAKKALADAQARKVAPALIRELEKSIAALEELTEAVKSIKNVSDEEFNMLINRVFDAISAVGDTSLTFKSEEERKLQVKEIKTDLADAKTQNELNAEDIAQIRAEHQATKAREKEADKYKPRSRSSFKGFQDFINSLYRAIALQVHTEETQDDSWSALNRRHSGAGVLQPGKRVNELPNKKIPIIDFYFDQSGSWTASDIAVGQKAVEKLADMEAEGKIKINLYYFSNHVFNDSESARNEGGTMAWNEIVKNVISTQATNVVIMTDADMENRWFGDKALSYTVPGYVWYLWRDGDNAPRLPRDLKGRGGTQQFSFSRSDL